MGFENKDSRLQNKIGLWHLPWSLIAVVTSKC